MSDFRRIIKRVVNVEDAELATADNFDVREQDRPRLFRRTQAVFVIDLRLEDGTPFAPDIGSSWNFNIDSVFDPNHADLVASTDADFNIIGDRPDLDIAAGKISFRVDTTSTALEDDMGSVEEKDMTAELYMTPPGVTSILLAQFTVRMRNIATDITETSELVLQSTALIRADGNDTLILFPDGSVAERHEAL